MNSCPQFTAEFPGFAAVLASQTLWTPWDVVTQRLMVAAGGGAPASESSFFGVARNVFATSGWIGFYRGFGAFCNLDSLDRYGL